MLKSAASCRMSVPALDAGSVNCWLEHHITGGGSEGRSAWRIRAVSASLPTSRTFGRERWSTRQSSPEIPRSNGFAATASDSCSTRGTEQQAQRTFDYPCGASRVKGTLIHAIGVYLQSALPPKDRGTPAVRDRRNDRRSGRRCWDPANLQPVPAA